MEAVVTGAGYSARVSSRVAASCDIVAGLVLTTMLVPVGIAYAVASGVPGIYGLYATIVPLLAYAVFGPSRILVLGPDSSLAAVILGVVLPLSGGDPHRAIALAGVMAVVSGIVCILAGVARLGFITELLSKPIRYGYMNGIALTVLVSQLPKLFGFSIEGDGPLRELWAIAEAILNGKANWIAVRGRRRHVGRNPLTQELHTRAWNTDRRCRRDCDRWCIEFSHACRRVGLRSASPGPPCIHYPMDYICRHRSCRDRRLGRRPRVVCRYECPLARLCGANPHECGSQPRNGWTWSR